MVRHLSNHLSDLPNIIYVIEKADVKSRVYSLPGAKGGIEVGAMFRDSTSVTGMMDLSTIGIPPHRDSFYPPFLSYPNIFTFLHINYIKPTLIDR